MNKRMFILTNFAMVLFLAACGNNAQDSAKEDQVVNGAAEETTESLKLLENEKTGKYLAEANSITVNAASIST